MSKTTNKFAPEVRERAVLIVDPATNAAHRLRRVMRQARAGRMVEANGYDPLSAQKGETIAKLTLKCFGIDADRLGVVP